MSSNSQVDLMEFKKASFNMTQQANSTCNKQVDSSQVEDRKLMLLETLVNNQNHMIELLGLLNNNLEELIIDIKDIKSSNLVKNHQIQSSSTSNLLRANSNLSSTSSTTTSCAATKKQLNTNIQQINLSNNTNQLNGFNHLNLQHLNNQQFISNGVTHQQEQNTCIANTNSNIQNGHRMDIPSSEPYKTLKTGLREFSTFVSKMVRQEFGPNFLALTRINELDRYIMQKIRDEAISKYLPSGVSPQFAWNHAMNSLRQLRHRQCKKARITL